VISLARPASGGRPSRQAERERRAKIINAQGEFQAAEKLADAADIMARNLATLQLRSQQTLLELGVNQNSTIVFPLPIDLLKPFTDAVAARGSGAGRRPHRPCRWSKMSRTSRAGH
jgi:regulator of protease activity HflC (stomatin/prohibitin superfamily)